MDYMIYVASYKDLIRVVRNKIKEYNIVYEEQINFIKDCGKYHYEHDGKYEIETKKHDEPCFDPCIYIANYPDEKDYHWNEKDDVLDTDKVCHTYITYEYPDDIPCNPNNYTKAYAIDLLRCDDCIRKVQIFGERCSGTNYLDNLMHINFNVTTIKHHFFGHHKLLNKNTKGSNLYPKILFICIVRNPVDWINSLYRQKHLLPKELCTNDCFLNDKFYSVSTIIDNVRKEYKENLIKDDLSIYTGDKYENIFDLRYTKLKFIITHVKKIVKNFIFVRHEDFLENFDETMKKIQRFNLELKQPKQFPINTNQYKYTCKVYDPTQKGIENFSLEEITRHKSFNKFFESFIGYNYD